MLGGARAVPRHRHLSKRGALDVAPALKPDTLTGAITFHDAQVDDARHTVMLARTAAAHGAVLASSAKCTGLLRSGDRVTGVHVLDAESGRELTVRARHVISAAGVWTDGVQDMAGAAGSGFRVRASKGVHILVPRERIRSDAAILVRAEDSVLFIRPWGRHWLIGTTDTRWDLDPSDPVPTRQDVDYLMRNVNRVISPPLTSDMVTGVYAGLRPLLSGDAAVTSRLARDHAVASPAPGLTVVAGGKYTTYRVMARDAVTAAGHDLDRAVPPSRTDEIPLLGAEGYHAVPRSAPAHLSRRYGGLATDLLQLMTDNPSLADPVPGTEEYLMAEAYYAVTHEGALHLEDILARRLHLATETADGGLRAADAVAPLVAGPLGWSPGTVAAEIERYRAWITAGHSWREHADPVRGR